MCVFICFSRMHRYLLGERGRELCGMRRATLFGRLLLVAVLFCGGGVSETIEHDPRTFARAVRCWRVCMFVCRPVLVPRPATACTSSQIRSTRVGMILSRNFAQGTAEHQASR